MTTFSCRRSLAPNRAFLAFACLIVLAATLSQAGAQSVAQSGAKRDESKPESVESNRSDRIHDQLTSLHTREEAHAPTRELGYRWTVLGFEYSQVGESVNSENAYGHALDYLSKSPEAAALYAEALDQLGAVYRIYGRIEESINCRRKSLAIRRKLGDPEQIARSQGHLAELALLSKHYKEAFAGADGAYRSLGSMTGMDLNGKGDLVSALLVRAYAQCGPRRRAECLSDAQQALTTSRGNFPEYSPEVAGSLVALSFAQLHSGEAAEAEDSARRALAILKTELTGADPRLTYALSQDRDCLVALHRKDEAREIDRQLSVVDREPLQSCLHCTVSIYGLQAPRH